MLPKLFTCRFCKDEIELDDNELGLVRVVCPSCDRALQWADIIPEEVSVLPRMGSMILDHVIMCIVAAIFYSMTSDLTNYGVWIYLWLVGFALYFCKDVVDGRSLAKRVLKLAVVDSSTGKPSTPVQTIIRNAFCILWPVEVFVTLVNPSRRIGDFVAGTRVVRCESSIAERVHRDYRQILISFAIAYVAMLLCWEFMMYIVKPIPRVPSTDKVSNDIRQIVLPNLKDVTRFENHGYYSTDMSSDSALHMTRLYTTAGDSFDIYLLYVLSSKDVWELKRWNRPREDK